MQASTFTIVAPQRVQVPQVEVRITASTPSALLLAENSAANAFADATAVPFPVVVEQVMQFSNDLPSHVAQNVYWQQRSESFAYTGSYPP